MRGRSGHSTPALEASPSYAIQQRLRSESTIYLGDLLHFPYGPRYQEEVKRFAFEIIRYLVSRDVKLIVIVQHRDRCGPAPGT